MFYNQSQAKNATTNKSSRTSLRWGARKQKSGEELSLPEPSRRASSCGATRSSALALAERPLPRRGKGMSDSRAPHQSLFLKGAQKMRAHDEVEDENGSKATPWATHTAGLGAWSRPCRHPFHGHKKPPCLSKKKKK